MAAPLLEDDDLSALCGLSIALHKLVERSAGDGTLYGDPAGLDHFEIDAPGIDEESGVMASERHCLALANELPRAALRGWGQARCDFDLP